MKKQIFFVGYIVIAIIVLFLIRDLSRDRYKIIKHTITDVVIIRDAYVVYRAYYILDHNPEKKISITDVEKIKKMGTVINEKQRVPTSHRIIKWFWVGVLLLLGIFNFITVRNNIYIDTYKIMS